MARSIHVQFTRLPSGLACYPRVLLTRRPSLAEVTDPHEFHARVERVPIAAKDVAAYARVCGFDGAVGVPVTFPHVLAMPLHLKIFALDSFPLRPMGLIHLSNRIERPMPLAAGMQVAVQVSARNYRKTDAGLVFDMDTEMSNADGVAWRETCTFLSRWPAEVAERTGGGRPPRPPKAPKDSAVLAELEVSLRTAWDYARVSRDFNPIHLNDRAARFFGLRGAISHGMWSLARSLAQRPVPDYPREARIDTQFLTPVQLPAKVNIKEWTEQGEVKRAMCDVRTGRVHMYAHWSVDGAARKEEAPH